MRPGKPFLLVILTNVEDYDSKRFDKKMPLFYSEMLDYFKEVRSGYPDVYNIEFILWKKKEITIETFLEMFEGIYFVQDLLNLLSSYLWKIYKGNITYN